MSGSWWGPVGCRFIIVGFMVEFMVELAVEFMVGFRVRFRVGFMVAPWGMGMGSNIDHRFLFFLFLPLVNPTTSSTLPVARVAHLPTARRRPSPCSTPQPPPLISHLP